MPCCCSCCCCCCCCCCARIFWNCNCMLLGIASEITGFCWFITEIMSVQKWFTRLSTDFNTKLVWSDLQVKHWHELTKERKKQAANPLRRKVKMELTLNLLNTKLWLRRYGTAASVKRQKLATRYCRHAGVLSSHHPLAHHFKGRKKQMNNQLDFKKCLAKFLYIRPHVFYLLVYLLFFNLLFGTSQQNVFYKFLFHFPNKPWYLKDFIFKWLCRNHRFWNHLTFC